MNERPCRVLRLLSLIIAALVTATPVRAEKRVALVVGISAYDHAPALTNPLNDARDVSAALKAVGFDVTEAFDIDRRGFDDALRRFSGKIAAAGTALFFYAGHGLQVGAQNFLVPRDARLERERDLEFEAVRLDVLLRQMELDREGKTSIVILDACRDNPLTRNLARSMGTRSASIGRGLAATATGLGTFIAYSTQPGNVALDGRGRNSPFAAALVKHMGVKGRSLPATMIEVRKEVVEETGGRQVPWDHSALTSDFQFAPGDVVPPVPIAAVQPAGDVAALQERLARLEAEARAREAAAKPLLPPAVNAPPAKSALNAPPIQPKPGVPKVSPDFEDVDNVGLLGVEIRSFKAPSQVACREACNTEADCVGYQHGRRNPVSGMCQLFSRIDARREDIQWRSGLRKESGAAVVPTAVASARAALNELVPPTRTERGFAFYEGVVVDGTTIKTSSADSAAGCAVVCRNTTGCVAAFFQGTKSGANACVVFRELKTAKSIGSQPGVVATAIVKEP
jgi:uncharacterized caspase-like protein